MSSSLKLLALTGLLPLLAIGSARLPKPSAGPGAVKQMYKKLFSAMDRGDAKALVEFFRPHPHYPSSMFASRFHGEALDLRGNSKIRKTLQGWMAERKAGGGKYKTKILSMDVQCHSPGLSYANLVFETSHTGVKKPMLRQYRLSSLLNYQKGVWGVFHWHLSPAAVRSPRADSEESGVKVQDPDKGAPKKR